MRDAGEMLTPHRGTAVVGGLGGADEVTVRAPCTRVSTALTWRCSE